MLCMLYNTDIQDNTPTPFEVQRQLQKLIPSSWQLRLEKGESERGPDALFSLAAPDGRRATLVLEIKRRLDPVAVPRVAERMWSWTGDLRATGAILSYLVVAPYLSDRTRERLRSSNLNYLDLTGNSFLQIDQPGIYIQTQGASRDPNKAARPARSLRGAKAAQVVRALVDFRPPLGIRQIAQIAGTDPGNVSRLVLLLEREALVRRSPAGGVEEVLWDELLRAWARDYSLTESNRVYMYLDPRGLDNFLSRLRGLPPEVGYAVTGSLAASRWAPAAPARMGMAFVRDAPGIAGALGLVSTEAGANVLLIEPKGDFVFERTVVKEGITYVAPSQAVADLLPGLGRNPTEAEELLEWMRKNESVWRA